MEKRKARILFVDDDEALGEMVLETLLQMGYEASTESDPRKVVTQFATRPVTFDAVILDQLMPGLSGLDLARYLSSVQPDLPVILLSGYPEMIYVREVEGANIRAVLFKPLTRPELSRALDRALSAPQGYKESADNIISSVR